MRQPTIAALAVGLALVSCSSGEDDADGNKAMSSGEIAAKADAAPNIQPGRYETKATLLDFEMPNIPGMPAGQMNNMKAMVAGEMAKPSTYCLTAEEAREGPKRMLNHLSESDCTVSKFDTSASIMSGEMQCNEKSGMTGTVKIDGSYAGDRSTTVMDWRQQMPGVPGDGVHMKMRVEAHRIGECGA